MAVAASKPMIAAKEAELALLKSANIALLNFASQDIPGILPNSEMQQQAYVQLRTTKKRATSQDLLNYLASRSSSSGDTAEVAQEYGAVPKTNFPGGTSPGGFGNQYGTS